MKSLRDDCFQAAQRPVFYLLGFAAIIKISVLLISGPSFDPDSNGITLMPMPSLIMVGRSRPSYTVPKPSRCSSFVFLDTH
jgi:hypothetical protein